LMSRWVGSTLERQDALNRLEEACRQLKEVNRLKDEFLATVSHEFRTPLTAIKAAAWILEQRLEGELNASQQGIVSIVITHADHLHRMINDLLDLSKMESGEMRYKHAEGDLARLAREVSISLSQLYAEKDIELALELRVESAPATFDHDRLRQVLLNLLANAAKFTSRGGKVTLRLLREAAGVRLEVEDTGIGLASEHFEKIFQKFYQVDGSSTRSVGGTGLGLAICKAIVEEGHHGRIWVESAVGEGSIFIVTLPTASNPELTALDSPS
ncbi:MAG TPA: HAMP domain-containing sensor histidine kinase, partial [Stenomitos sp.]